MSTHLQRRVTLIYLLLVIMLTSCGAENVSDETNTRVPVMTATPVEIATLVPPEDPTNVPPTSASEPISELATPTVADLPTEIVGNESKVAQDVTEALYPILNAYKQLGDAQSLRVISNTCSDLTVAASYTFEFIQPDMYRNTITYKDGTIAVEEVGIGDVLYRQRDETWEILPLDTILYSSNSAWVFTVGGDDNVELLLNDMKTSALNVQMTGQESLNGRMTQVYKYETTNPFELWTFWIGERDGRLYQEVKSWEVDSDDESYTCAPITTYEYDIPLEIEPPITNQ